MTIELGQQISAFLAAHYVMSVATLGPSGPHAISLLYACDGLALVGVAETESQHSREIESDPRAAATGASDYLDFAGIRGVQIASEARRIEAADAFCD